MSALSSKSRFYCLKLQVSYYIVYVEIWIVIADKIVRSSDLTLNIDLIK